MTNFTLETIYFTQTSPKFRNVMHQGTDGWMDGHTDGWMDQQGNMLHTTKNVSPVNLPSHPLRENQGLI